MASNLACHPTRRVVGAALALAVAVAPASGAAASGPAPEAGEDATADEPDADGAQTRPTEPDAADDADPSTVGDDEVDDVVDDEVADDEVVDDEVVDDDADDADAATDDVATDDDETIAPDDDVSADEALPKLSRMQTAGWWTLFAGFAVGTTAGVFAGLSERQEDRAVRLATLFDAETGAQPLYADEQAEYEKILDRGRAYQRTAIGLAVVTGVTVAAAVTLFSIDASRRRGKGRTARRWQLRPTAGGWQVRF